MGDSKKGGGRRDIPWAEVRKLRSKRARVNVSALSRQALRSRSQARFDASPHRDKEKWATTGQLTGQIRDNLVAPRCPSESSEDGREGAKDPDIDDRSRYRSNGAIRCDRRDIEDDLALEHIELHAKHGGQPHGSRQDDLINDFIAGQRERARVDKREQRSRCRCASTHC